jgi:hypothetical protein
MSVMGQGYAAADIVRQRPTDNSPLRCAKAARLRDHWDLKSRGLRLSTRSGQVAGGRPSKLL